MKNLGSGLLMAACCLLAACGGGQRESAMEHRETAAQHRQAQAARVQAAESSAPLVSPAEAARQLFDFAEASYPEHFPGHQPTLLAAPFAYRHYPGSGTYLGVVAEGDPGYAAGVYVMGGAFGATPVRAGAVHEFIAPKPSQISIELANNGLTADPARGVYYVSVAGSVIGKGNRVATVDAQTGAVTLSAPVGSEPGAMAVAADGKSLYVAIAGSAEIVRLQLPSMVEIARVRLPHGSPAEALAASPTHPGLLAASTDYGTTYLLRDMVVQTNAALLGHPITFGTDGGVYGLDTNSSGFRLTRADVVADGLKYSRETFADTGYYWHAVERAGARIITRNKVWNAADLTKHGTVGVVSDCLPRSASRMVCFTTLFNYQYEAPRALLVDIDSMTLLEELALPYELDDARPVLGPGATAAFRVGIAHPAHTAASKVVIVRDEMLR